MSTALLLLDSKSEKIRVVEGELLDAETPVKKLSREDWLLLAIGEFRSNLFKRNSFTVPQVKVSISLPSTGRDSKRIGEHWDPSASADSLGTVFINPVLDDSVRILEVLVHELVHAVVGNAEGHGKVFKACALKVGLTGKMTSSTAGAHLQLELMALIQKLGRIPHCKLDISKRPTKRQKGRNLLQECLTCGYKVRGSRKHVEEKGPLICPCNGLPMKAEGNREDKSHG